MTLELEGSNSFDKFYKETSPRTFGSACRMAAGDRELANDATQDAYLIMFDRWHERSGCTAEDNRRYVAGIAINKVCDWFRKHRSFDLDQVSDMAIDDFGYANVLAELSVIDPVRDLIDRQPTGRRAIGILYFVEEIYDYGEIATRLGLSESTVRTQVKRLRDRLQPLMNEVNGTSRGAKRK